MVNVDGELGSNIRKVCEDEMCAVYQLKDDAGEGLMTFYQVFPGCMLIYNDFHMEHCNSRFVPNADMFCIDHCREGRLEWQSGDRYFYIKGGDMQANSRQKHCGEFSFPLKHYHGLTVGFDINQAEQSLPHVMEGFSVDLRKLRDKFCANDKTFVMRAGKQIEHIFSELYDLPEKVRQPYFKIKVLELLLFLDALEIPADCGERQYFYKAQVDKARDIVTLLTSNLERWYTLEEISGKFDFPLTSLKKCFQGVYGCSIAAYMKEFRMNAAAGMLKRTDEPIISIASRVGYDNPGKFAAAFRSVLGVTPSEYRRLNA